MIPKKGGPGKSAKFGDPGHLVGRMHILRLQKVGVRRVERVSKR